LLSGRAIQALGLDHAVEVLSGLYELPDHPSASKEDRLLGRDAELALAEASARSTEVESGLVVFTGGLGVGKSH
jgi:hypothetical protein